MKVLELCARIQEICLIPNSDRDALQRLIIGKGSPVGKALLFDLMVKYKVEVNYDSNLVGVLVRIGGTASGWEYTGSKDYETDKGIPRAILECIVEANNNAQ